VYRRAAVEAAGGFDERFFAYLEDVDLGLRLRLAGWTCRYEPAVARHAGGGSGAALSRGSAQLVARNTVWLVARSFPARWLGPVLYRQAALLVDAARTGTLGAYVRGLAAGVRGAPEFLRERGPQRRGAVVPVAEAVPDRPWRGPRAGGHPEAPE
jgi:GT2 family glycosyltransferase